MPASTSMTLDRLQTLRARLEQRHREALAQHAVLVDDRRFILTETDADLQSLASSTRALRDVSDVVGAIGEMLCEIRDRLAELSPPSSQT